MLPRRPCPGPRAVRALCVAALLAALALPGPAAARSHATAPPAGAIEGLQALAADKGACATLEARYAVGTGLHGYTYVTVKSGAIDVKRTWPGRKDATYSGKLTAAECRAVARAVVTGKLWTVQSKKKSGVPDETRPTLAAGVSGATFSITVWASEGRQSKAFSTVEARMLDLAKRVSKGQVTY